VNYRIRLSFDAAHWLPNYNGPCANLHGHTWHVEFYVAVPIEFDQSGIGIDFKELKRVLTDILPDHRLVNDVVTLPSAENIVQYLIKQAHRRDVPVTKVVLWETDDNGIELEAE
jgi:6-pyruvoyltetrahydropterin/6-carboxytetrahydropterin synthase